MTCHVAARCRWSPPSSSGSTYLLRTFALALALVAFAACGEDPLSPPGTVSVQIGTVGVDGDPSYDVRAAGKLYTTPGVPATLNITGLHAGRHQIALEGIAANCSVVGSASVAVEVQSGRSLPVNFVVSCVSVTGAVAVTTSVTGGGSDPDGFTIQFGTATPRVVAAGDTTFYVDLPGRDYPVTLGGMSSNCTVGQNPRSVHVTTGVAPRDTARTTFAVTCTPLTSGIRVVTQTTGADLDPDGYIVAIDVLPTFAIPTNGSVTKANLLPGGHSVRLDGIASNCTLSGPNPRLATVTDGNTVDVAFAIACAALARIEVSATTTGVDPDRDGYRVVLSRNQPIDTIAVSAGGTALSDRVPFGTYSITVTDLAPNCEVSGPMTRSVEARASIVPVAVTVNCVTLERIAFAMFVAQNWDIYTSKADGSDQRRITTGSAMDVEPSWSAATGRIAYASGYFGNSDIHVVDENGASIALTANAGRNLSPAWSPDGARIAFTSNRSGTFQLYVMDADGGNVRRITSGPVSAMDPAWSPDGTKLAFTRADCSSFGCLGNIWLINADGEGQAPTRLTDVNLDAHPAWSADGSRIAFSRVNQCSYDYYYYSCERNLAVINANGTNLMVLPGDAFDEADPSWSATGARIVMGLSSCGYYACSDHVGIRVVRPDGSDPVTIIWGRTTGPVFRR